MVRFVLFDFGVSLLRRLLLGASDSFENLFYRVWYLRCCPFRWYMTSYSYLTFLSLNMHSNIYTLILTVSLSLKILKLKRSFSLRSWFWFFFLIWNGRRGLWWSLWKQNRQWWRTFVASTVICRRWCMKTTTSLSAQLILSGRYINFLLLSSIESLFLTAVWTHCDVQCIHRLIFMFNVKHVNCNSVK
jgi:hypothetical protein